MITTNYDGHFSRSVNNHYPKKCVCCGLQILICKNRCTGESVQWDHHARDSKDDQVIMIIMMIMMILIHILL